MNFDQIIPLIYMIGVLILVLPSFLQSNSKLKQLLTNLSIWVIIVLIVTTIAYFLFRWKKMNNSHGTTRGVWKILPITLPINPITTGLQGLTSSIWDCILNKIDSKKSLFYYLIWYFIFRRNPNNKRKLCYSLRFLLSNIEL